MLKLQCQWYYILAYLLLSILKQMPHVAMPTNGVCKRIAQRLVIPLDLTVTTFQIGIILKWSIPLYMLFWQS